MIFSSWSLFFWLFLFLSPSCILVLFFLAEQFVLSSSLPSVWLHSHLPVSSSGTKVVVFMHTHTVLTLEMVHCNVGSLWPHAHAWSRMSIEDGHHKFSQLFTWSTIASHDFQFTFHGIITLGCLLSQKPEWYLPTAGRVLALHVAKPWPKSQE